MASKNIFALKHNGKFLGVTQTTSNYLLGFYFHEHAHRVRGIIGESPKVMIKSAPQTNVSRDVKLTLLNMELPIYNVKDDIFLDSDARVAFQKTTSLADSLIEPVAFERFLALPYANTFGLVMPYEIVDEDDTYLVYKANLIEGFYRT